MDIEFEFSRHSLLMLYQRRIKAAWVSEALEEPVYREIESDEIHHYIKNIEEKEGRFLRVVVNISKNPYLIVTCFFDRRLGRKL